MNTQAISNRAMNYENAQERFKISKLEMKVEDDHLNIQIYSPLLSANNHTIVVLKNKLRLKITNLPEAGKPITMPLECDLFLPKHGYNSIIEEKAIKGLITIKLAKKKFRNSVKFLSKQNIA